MNSPALSPHASSPASSDALSVSVVIVTMNRPDCMKLCLDALRRQTQGADQIIVVDASRDDRTRELVAQYPEAHYLFNTIGYGHMTHSRNLGLQHATGDIVAFIDDDAYAHPTWRAEIVKPYADPRVGAVGGRALRGTRGESTTGVESIGVLRRNGVLDGNFGADPGRDLKTFHIIGCNMSFRRSILADLGGLREDYTGTEVREETDICARVKKLGFEIIFAHQAVVDHVGAPQVKGGRGDLRYAYYARRNHFVFLIRNFGPLAPIAWRFVPTSLQTSVRAFKQGRKSAPVRLLVEIAGSLAGILAGWVLVARTGTSPIRRDARGRELSEILKRSAPVAPQP